MATASVPAPWSMRARSRLAAELRAAGTRQVAVTLAGNVGRLALSFVGSVIIARALGPPGYGLIALVAAVFSVADTVADFGLTPTAVRAIAIESGRSPEHAGRIARGYLSLALVANLAVAAVGVAAAGPLTRGLLGRPGAVPAVRLALLGLITVAGSGAVAAVLQATRRFAALAALGIATAATSLVALGILARLGVLTVTAVIAVGVVNPIVGLALGRALLPAGSLRISESFGRAATGAWRELVGFSKWMWVSAIFSLLASQLDLLLLNHWASPAALGTYALAFNLAQKLDIVNQARFTVLLPTASALATPERMTRYLRTTSSRSLLLVAGIALAIPMWRPFISTFYGPGFADALGPLVVLTAVAALDAVTTPLVLLALPLAQPRALALSDAVRVAVLVATGWLLMPSLGPLGAALARLASRVAGAAVILPLIAVRMRRSSERAGA